MRPVSNLMRSTLQEMRKFASQLGLRRLLVMGGVGAALLLGLAFLASRGGGDGRMGFLFTDLEPAAAQSIAEKLKGKGVDFTLSPDGSAVLAPVDQLPALRMEMAADRLGGKIGYEILDEEEPFGVSSSRARMNETRAIEGELARSINSLDQVQAARVHIVMPERELFASAPRKASAAVTLKTGSRLPPETVQSIRSLVSSAVPDLLASAVSVVDQRGTLLARGGEEGISASGDIDAQQTATEARMRSQIETMLEPIVGAGRVRAEVAAVLERDRTRQEADTFDPDQQVIGHQVTVESNDQSDASAPGAEGATVSTQLPDANQAIAGGSNETQRSARAETSEDTTFQNSRTRTVSERAPGKVERLSVAVMVDGGEKGLTPAQIAKFTRLVEGAVGFDAARGDNVVVEGMRFTGPAADDVPSTGILGIQPAQILDFLKWAALAAGLAVAAWFLRGRLRPAEPMMPGNHPAELPAPVEQGLLPEGDAARQLEAPADARGELALLDQDIALAEADGSIRQSALKRIGDAIARSPIESTAIVRQWMNA